MPKRLLLLGLIIAAFTQAAFAFEVGTYRIQFHPASTSEDVNSLEREIAEQPSRCQEILKSRAEGDFGDKPDIPAIAMQSEARYSIISTYQVKGKPGEELVMMPITPLIHRSIACAEGFAPQTFNLFRPNSDSTNLTTARHRFVIPENGTLEVVQFDFATVGPIYPYRPASKSAYAGLVYHQVFYLLLIGGILAIAFYNLFLWIGAHKAIYKLNVYYLVFLFLQQTFLSEGYPLIAKLVHGLPFEYVWLKLMDAQFCSTAFFTWAFAFKFLIAFFRIERSQRFIFQLTRFIVISSLSLGVLSFFTFIFLPDYASFWVPVTRGFASFGAITNIFLALYYCYRDRRPVIFIYALSVLVISAGATFYVSFLEGTFPLNIWSRNSLLIASFLEALLLSITVGYQARLEEMDASKAKDLYTDKLARSNLELSLERARLQKEVRLMLDGVPLGILSIEKADEILRIAPDYSKNLSGTLGFENKANVEYATFMNLLEIVDEDRRLVDNSLMACLNEDEIAWEMNSNHFPTFLKTGEADEGQKYFRLTWSPYINGSGIVEKVLVTISDETDLEVAIKAASEGQHKVQIIGELHHIPSSTVDRFLSEAEQSFKRAKTMVDDLVLATNIGSDPYRQLFMIFHTMKGLVLSLNLSILANGIHRFESTMETAKASNIWNDLPDQLHRLKLLLGDYSQLHRELSLRNESFGMIAIDENELRLAIDKGGSDSLKTYINKPALNFITDLPSVRGIGNLNKIAGKAIQLVVTDSDIPHFIDIKYTQLFDSIITHLLRNSIDHGIESSEERISLGKDPVGRARIHLQSSGFTFEDDGGGLNLDAIRAKALSLGILGESMSDFELSELIFQPNFSTRSEVTIISGRGVGLDSVRSLVEKEGGGIHIDLIGEKIKGRAAFRFVIDLPGAIRIDQRSRHTIETTWKSESKS